MLLAFSLTYLSCLSFSLSLKRHFQHILPEYQLSERKARILKCVGWLLLILSTVLCKNYYGIATALVILCGLFSSSALLIALLLQYATRGVLVIIFALLLVSGGIATSIN